MVISAAVMIRNEPTPCRLSVFLAREAPVGVILRRGPSAWAQLTRWERRSDTFEPGQWFHGRVYERRCDLSPDGQLFIYFAAKHWRTADEDQIGEGWTAISRPPYFTALALWLNLGSWYGGGVFKDAKHVLLDVTCSLDPHPAFQPRGLTYSRCPPDSAPWEQGLLLSGWRLVERGFDPRTHRRVGQRELWEKPSRDGALKLCREVEDVDFSRFGGPYSDTYWLEAAGDLVPLSGVSWADWEDGKRLAFVRDGVLYQALWQGTELREAVLFDFNPLEPAELAAPDWAKTW
ncbi:MAG TPA: hypothetical protein VHG92_07320 [Afifellaceae bacterium]|nr:hypothetical protein [Afifellaceae bacterium]